MPLINKKRNPENWLAQVQEVQARIARQKTQKARKVQLDRMGRKRREAREALRVGRKSIREKLKLAREGEFLLLVQMRQKRWLKGGLHQA